MPINPLVAAAAISTGGQLLGGLFGRQRPQAAVPRDIAGLRSGQINLLQSLLQPGAFGAGGAGTNLFGPLGVEPTGLQRQATGGISQFLNQPAPETRAFDVSRPILEGMLTGTGPQFEQDISRANVQGGRFGSANAILRGEALRNLFNQRTQVAQTLGMLAGQAGQAPFNRLLQGFGVGQQEAGQADIETQRRLQLLVGLLGQAQGATLGLPITQEPNLASRLGTAGGGISQLLMLLPFLQGLGGRGGAPASFPQSSAAPSFPAFGSSFNPRL